MFEKVLDLIKTSDGRKFVSILWGFGLACMFFKVCKNRKCIVYSAPSRDKIHNKIFKSKSSCYTYRRKDAECINDVIEEKFRT